MEQEKERVYINRECISAYVVMAIHSISNSANKERTIEDFLNEIRTMTEVYTDENVIMSLLEAIMKNEGNKIKIKVLK